MESPDRQCRKCKAWKALSEFHRRSKTDARPDSYCKGCRQEFRREWGRDPANAAALSERARQRRRAVRERVFAHYGRECASCREAQYEFLALDHIDGGGSAHRALLGQNGRGQSFYIWIIKQGFPVGYRTLCHNCNAVLGLYGYCPHAAAARDHGGPTS